MKPTVTTLRTARPKRIAGYTANIGPISATMATEHLATELCEELTLAALKRLAYGLRVWKWQGHVYVVAPATDGFVYWIDTSDSQYATCSAYPTHEAAGYAALHHLAQNTWTPETDDTAFLSSLKPYALRQELASWIGFQRAYIRERLAGTSPHLIHAAACERPEPIAIPA